MEPTYEQLDEADAQARRDPHRLANAARWYVVELHYPVFPIMPGTKRPATGHGFKDATLDPDQVQAWWTREPHANVAMPTGVLFNVIDCDGPEGVQTLWGSQPLGGCLADHIPVVGHVLTPRDGGHHLYVNRTPHGNTTNIWPGCDYRGDGGYVLLPPSRIDGREYRWTQLPPLGGLDHTGDAA